MVSNKGNSITQKITYFFLIFLKFNTNSILREQNSKCMHYIRLN